MEDVNGCVLRHNLTETGKRLKVLYSLHDHDDKIKEELNISETSNFYKTTRRSNPEDIHLCIRRRKKLKSHFMLFI